MKKKPDTEFLDELVKEDKNNKKGTIMKNHKESIKTIVITVLVTAIVFFILGMNYQENKNDQVKAEAATLVKNVAKPAPSKQ